LSESRSRDEEDTMRIARQKRVEMNEGRSDDEMRESELVKAEVVGTISAAHK
jgi:hypothetical protein